MEINWSKTHQGTRAVRWADGGCEKLASKNLHEIPGSRRMTIQPKPLYERLGPVFMPGKEGGVISGWFDHEAVYTTRGDGIRVFNALTGKAGMPFEEYRALFQHCDGILFRDAETNNELAPLPRAETPVVTRPLPDPAQGPGVTVRRTAAIEHLLADHSANPREDEDHDDALE